jgi:predicted nucleotidyltransferase
MNYFEARVESTEVRLSELTAFLSRHLGTDADRILGADTCVYVVGSGGRGEMSVHSDVDLFVTRVDREPSAVDAFHVRQAIARSLFDMKLPEPSQGGEFLKMHTAAGLCERMGTPEDDASNTFTARATNRLIST